MAARRLEHARRAAAEFGACVLLKGSTTVVAPPHDLDPVLINTTGTSWLATAGTGDVLAGLAGALLAQGLAAPQAALCAAYLHGLAARLAAVGTDRAGQAAAGEGDAAARPRSARPMWWRRSRPRSARSRHSISGYGQPCGGQRRARRDHQEHRGGARSCGPCRGDGGGQGQRVRPRRGSGRPRGDRRRRRLAGRRARGRGARAAQRRPRRADPVPDGRPRARPRRGHRGRGGPVGRIGGPGPPAGRRRGGRPDARPGST